MDKDFLITLIICLAIIFNSLTSLVLSVRLHNVQQEIVEIQEVLND